MKNKNLIKGADGKLRCWWAGDDPLYVHYHDTEWGRPVDDDVRLFEKICLEGFQSGLSWITILKKRENFRKAFAGFDFEKVARFGARDVERLLKDSGIVRHRGKIEAAINNAQKVLDVIDEFGSLADYFWSFEVSPSPVALLLPLPNGERVGVRGERLVKGTKSRMDIPNVTPESTALSKDLRNRGFKFVGPTTMYAHMQAMGMVNDHVDGCHCRKDVERERKAFDRPASVVK